MSIAPHHTDRYRHFSLVHWRCRHAAWIASLVVPLAQALPLPERTVDLSAISVGECKFAEWRLAHGAPQVVICHSAPPAITKLGAAPPAPPDAAALLSQARDWRERVVDDNVANGIHTMLTALDSLPDRSLHPEWRVLLAVGAFGCQPKVMSDGPALSFRDPCNGQRYDAEGRAVGGALPALAIPPYDIVGKQLIIGRLPATVTPAPPLPAIVFSDDTASIVAQLIRAARWGNLARLNALHLAGADVNSATEHGDTALLAAVQTRQSAAVAWLLQHGANASQQYASGMTALELARIVDAPDIIALLTQAGAR